MSGHNLVAIFRATRQQDPNIMAMPQSPTAVFPGETVVQSNNNYSKIYYRDKFNLSSEVKVAQVLP